MELGENLSNAAVAIGQALGLKGLTSFDAIIDETAVYLLEVNPRPGASLDVLDDDCGSLFREHMAACLDQRLPLNALSSKITKAINGPAKAMAILHADRGPIILNEIPWPDWSADRGSPGTFIPLGAPLATALAEAPTADAAEALARKRLAELEDLIYGHAKS